LQSGKIFEVGQVLQHSSGNVFFFRINPGITPLISNEIGPSSLVSYDELEKVKGQVKPDIINSAQTGLHSQSRDIHSRENSVALVAFPNDR